MQGISRRLKCISFPQVKITPETGAWLRWWCVLRTTVSTYTTDFCVSTEAAYKLLCRYILQHPTIIQANIPLLSGPCTPVSMGITMKRIWREVVPPCDSSRMSWDMQLDGEPGSSGSTSLTRWSARVDAAATGIKQQRCSQAACSYYPNPKYIYFLMTLEEEQAVTWKISLYIFFCCILLAALCAMDCRTGWAFLGPAQPFNPVADPLLFQ